MCAPIIVLISHTFCGAQGLRWSRWLVGAATGLLWVGASPGCGLQMPVQPRGWKPGIQEAQAICSAVQQSRWPCNESIPESSFAGVAHVCGAPGPGYRTARALATMASVTWRGTAHGVGAGLFVCQGGGRLRAALCSSLFGARHLLTLSPWPLSVGPWASTLGTVTWKHRPSLQAGATQGTRSPMGTVPGEALLLT